MNQGFHFHLKEWAISGARVEAATAVGSTRVFPRHAHQSWCVGVVVDGERVVECPDGALRLPAGRVFCIPPDTAHACRPGPQGRQDYIAVCFDSAAKAFGRLLERLRQRLEPLAADENSLHPAVRRALDALRDDKPGTQRLEDFARCAGASPFYFHRLATSQLGMTPRELALRARLRKARRLLEAGSSAAFSDQSRFIRHFKALMGRTPGRVYSARGRASS
jgi:methylphosphotriester-DNA--protein-cysteine methyltransferase